MLNEQQFQPELPGMPPRRQSLPVVQPHGASPPPYRSAHAEWEIGNDSVNSYTNPNPIYRDESWGEFEDYVTGMHDAAAYRGKRLELPDPRDLPTELVPTWRVESGQPTINEAAVEHQVQHADPFNLKSDPEITEYEDAEGTKYMVHDGNHRVNAALRRGQLFVPAKVRRLTY